MMDGRVMVSQDGLSQWHYQVVDNTSELDTDRIMVTTGRDLDPANIIAWLMEPRDTIPDDRITNDINTGTDDPSG